MSKTNSYRDTMDRHGEHAAFLRVMAEAEDLVSSAWPFEKPEGYQGLGTLAQQILSQQTRRSNSPTFLVVLEVLESYRNDPVYSGTILERTIELVEKAKEILKEREEEK